MEIETLSSVLSAIEFIVANTPFTGYDLVDCAAYLRTGKNKLASLDMLVSGLVEAVIPRPANELAGDHVLACRVEQTKFVLDTEKVKKSLGKDLPKFQKEQHVTYVQYKPKG